VTGMAKRILIVDDASLVRLYYRGILQGAGYAVAEALNGLEALETLLAGSADLVIVDVNMPKMDGMTFLRTLRQQTMPLAAIPALVVSTEGVSPNAALARAAGANFYLVKPASEETLLAYVRLLCGPAE
jgi:two-component system chemotaxis response regulator CheY